MSSPEASGAVVAAPMAYMDLFPTLSDRAQQSTLPPSSSGKGSVWGRQPLAVSQPAQQPRRPIQPPPNSHHNSASKGANSYIANKKGALSDGPPGFPPSVVVVEQLPPDARPNTIQLATATLAPNYRQLLSAAVERVRADLNMRVDSSSSNQGVFFVLAPLSATGTLLPEQVNCARRLITSQLSPKLEETVDIPGATVSHVVGTRGKVLGELRSRHCVDIRVPQRSSGADSEVPDSVTVKLIGDKEGIDRARTDILAIVREQVNRTSASMDIEREYFVFLFGPNYAEGAQQLGERFNVHVRLPDRQSAAARRTSQYGDTDSDSQPLSNSAVTIQGDKACVDAALKHLHSEYLQLQSSITTLRINLKKKQHRFVAGQKGQDLQEIFNETGCAVELPPAAVDDDTVTIRGPLKRLVHGLQTTLDKAASVAIEQLFVLPVRADNSLDAMQAAGAWKYLIVRERSRTLRQMESPSSVQMYFTSRSPCGGVLEVQGQPAAVQQVLPAIKSAVDSVRTRAFVSLELPADVQRHFYLRHSVTVNAETCPLLSGAISGQQQRLCDGLLAKYGIDVITTQAASTQQESSASQPDDTVWLCGPPGGAYEHCEVNVDFLQRVAGELRVWSTSVADWTEVKIEAKPELHARIIGAQGRGLATIRQQVAEELLGDTADPNQNSELSFSVQFPKEAKNGNDIVVRGDKRQVEVAVRRLSAVIDELRAHDEAHSHTDTVLVDKTSVAHIIGKKGQALEQLCGDACGDTKITFTEVDSPAGKVQITLRGTADGVRTAKKLITRRAQLIANEVTMRVPVDKRWHGSIIGKNGQYVKRLTDKYNVRIRFGGSGGSDKNDAETSDEVDELDDEVVDNTGIITIKGQRESVERARAEIDDLVAWEMSLLFASACLVPVKAVSQLLGRNGQRLAQLKLQAESCNQKKGNCNNDLDLAPELDVRLVGVDDQDDKGGSGSKRTQFDQRYALPNKQYDGQHLRADSDNKLLLVGGREPEVRAFIALVAEQVSTPNIVTKELALSAESVQYLTSQNRRRYVELLRQVTAGTPVDHQQDQEDDRVRAMERLVRISFPHGKKIKQAKQRGQPLPQIVVRGTPELVTATVQLLDQYFSGTLPQIVTRQCTVPAKRVGAIIGSGGSRLTQLSTQHDCDIDVGERNDSTTAGTVVISVTGRAERAAACTADIQNLATPPPRQ